MNIILLNQTWLHSELKALGHNIITAGWRQNVFNITLPWGASASQLHEEVGKYFDPDILIYYDNSSLPTLSSIEDLEIPKVFLSVDTFHHLAWHSDYSKLFNLTLVAQKDYVKKVIDLNRGESDVEWFPLWVNQNYEPATEKKYDVSFRGTLDPILHPERSAFFDKIAAHVDFNFGQGPIEEIYPKSKIVLNQAVRRDVNFRNYEAMMAGALLVTPYVENGLEDLFINGEHCIFYEDGNPDDALDKIQYYLAHDEERKQIANNGRRLVLNNHSSKAVAIKIETYLRKYVAQLPKRNLEASFIIQTFVTRALWQIMRVQSDESYMMPLEKAINQLQELISKNEISSIAINNFETAVVIADLICADTLDSLSYDLWRKTLINSELDSNFIKLLETAYQEGPHRVEAHDHLCQVRYGLVQQMLSIK